GLFRQAWRGCILPGVYLALCLGPVASGRRNVIGSVIGLSSRYVGDWVPVLALALALAYAVPLDRRGDPSWRRREGPRRLAARFRTWTFEAGHAGPRAV